MEEGLERGSWEKVIGVLNVCASSLCRGHANLLCIVPIFSNAMPLSSSSSSSPSCSLLWFLRVLRISGRIDDHSTRNPMKLLCVVLGFAFSFLFSYLFRPSRQFPWFVWLICLSFFFGWLISLFVSFLPFVSIVSSWSCVACGRLCDRPWWQCANPSFFSTFIHPSSFSLDLSWFLSFFLSLFLSFFSCLSVWSHLGRVSHASDYVMGCDGNALILPSFLSPFILVSLYFCLSHSFCFLAGSALSVWSHLGRVLHAGDYVMGYDLNALNLTDEQTELIKVCTKNTWENVTLGSFFLELLNSKEEKRREADMEGRGWLCDGLWWECNQPYRWTDRARQGEWKIWERTEGEEGLEERRELQEG